MTPDPKPPPDFWMKGGLVTGEHRKRMGDAIWLYSYLLQRVWFDGVHAGEFRGEEDDRYHYTHPRAAATLGYEERQVRRYFERLRDEGYITARRRPHHFDVAITKYVPPRQRAAEKRAQKAERTDTSVQSPENVNGHIRSSERTHLSMSTDTSVRSPRTRARKEQEIQEIPLPSVVAARASARPPQSNNIALFIDAMSELGMVKGEHYDLSSRDTGILKATSYPIPDVARCFTAVTRQEWGDTWLKAHATLDQVLKYVGRFKQGLPMTDPVPYENSPSAHVHRAIERARNGTPPAHDYSFPGSDRQDALLGDGETRRRLSS